MKEIAGIINAYECVDTRQIKAALATVVHVDGSSYRRTGARMLVLENGQLSGGISGGCLEGDALRRSKQAILSGKPSVVRYDTREEDAHQIGVGLGCNGVIDVLITPLDEHDHPHPVHILKSCLGDRMPNILITIIGAEHPAPGLEIGKMIRYQQADALRKALPGISFADQLLEDIRQVQANCRSTIQEYSFQGGKVTCFLEFLPPVIHFILHGGNYDLYPLLRLSKELGWKTSVVAPVKKLRKEAFERADNILAEKPENLEADAYTAALIMSHDYQTDLENLRNALQTTTPYIGVLGPRNRTEKLLDELEASGLQIGPGDLERIFSPAGLDIGAASPEEIALSILAEIQAFFSNRKGGFLKNRVGPIHERS